MTSHTTQGIEATFIITLNGGEPLNIVIQDMVHTPVTYMVLNVIYDLIKSVNVKKS